jgi:hypothetical protein
MAVLDRPWAISASTSRSRGAGIGVEHRAARRDPADLVDEVADVGRQV